jgi:uncharacterized protein (DUF58 family)
VYAKTDRLYTKRYEEETNLRCQILIDNSSSMFYPQENMGKVSFSIFAAACLAYMLQKQRDAVGITTFSNEIEWQSPVKSTSLHIHNLFVQLQRMMEQKPINKKTAAASVIHQIADKMQRRSLIVIFSDMFENVQKSEDIFSALNHLKHNQHEVLLFHVVDKKTETDFNFSDRPHEFIDLETGEKLKVQPSQIREIYKQKTEELFYQLKLKCGQFGIDFIEADIGKDINQILLPYLIKRSKMI